MDPGYNSKSGSIRLRAWETWQKDVRRDWSIGDTHVLPLDKKFVPRPYFEEHDLLETSSSLNEAAEDA